MSLTIRQAIIKALVWLIDHPKVLTMPLAPIPKHKIKMAYESQNSVTTFDADLLTEVRVQDATYVSMSDSDLQSLIDSTVGEDDLNNELASAGVGGGS